MVIHVDELPVVCGADVTVCVAYGDPCRLLPVACGADVTVCVAYGDPCR